MRRFNKSSWCCLSPHEADLAEPRVVNSNLKTFPVPNDIYARPVRKTGDGVGGTVAVVAE